MNEGDKVILLRNDNLEYYHIADREFYAEDILYVSTKILDRLYLTRELIGPGRIVNNKDTCAILNSEFFSDIELWEESQVEVETDITLLDPNCKLRKFLEDEN